MYNIHVLFFISFVIVACESMANIEGRIFCRIKNDSVVPLSYCRDVCPRHGDCPERLCGQPRWDSWQMRRSILKLQGFLLDPDTISINRRRYDSM